MKLNVVNFNKYCEMVEIDNLMGRMKQCYLNALERDIANFTNEFVCADYVDGYVNGFLEGFIGSTAPMNKVKLDYLNDKVEEVKKHLTEKTEGLVIYEN